MHTFSAAFVFLLSILPLVLSIPIPVWSSTVVKQPAVDDPASQTRVTAYNEADARAKEMVSKMVTVANSDKPEHKKIVNDAFGPNADRDKIKATIHKLNTEQVRIGTTDVAKVRDDLIATTPAKRPNGPMAPIKLGPKFFTDDASTDYRAGTLIHEATHQQSHTGDFINKNDKIIGALEDPIANRKMQDNGKPHVGYHFPGAEEPKKVPTSAADLSDKYKNNRDNIVKNMHDNADSYRVFAHLCSQPGVARRDIELFSRALLEADADGHFYLAKRDSCALPKDYFKNKAAAKDAPAGKGAKSIKPTSHSQLTKGAATKAQSHPVSKAGRKPSSLKAPTAGKGTKSNRPTSRLTKGAATKVQSHPVSKAGRKPSAPKAPKGAAKRVSRVASPRRTSLKGASGVKSHASTKSTKPISHIAKGAPKGTSRASPKAARKSVVKPLSGTAKRVNSPHRAQARVNHVAQKKVTAALPKKSTPHVIQKKVAGALPKKSTPLAALPKKAGKK